jgi:hypothetical protein
MAVTRSITPRFVITGTVMITVMCVVLGRSD